MRKQFFTNISTDFSPELQCSSIRNNAHPNSPPPPKPNLTNAHQQQLEAKSREDRLKKYEENSIVGFEMSLEIDDDNQNYCWDLLHSRSLNEPPTAKPEPLAKSRERTQYAGSLYNTSSFDEMTMKMSIPRSPHPHPASQPHLASQSPLPSAKHLRPAEMQSYRELYSDQDMTVNITAEKEQSRTAPSQGQLSKQEKRQQNQNFLQQLKCSMAESQHELSYGESSYEEPYFKTPTLTQLSDPKIEYDRNRLAVNENYSLKKFNSLEANRSQDKKLTLRDYLYLAQLTGQGRDKSPHSSRPDLLANQANLPSVAASRKKKQSSNEEVLGRIKGEIGKNIRAIQNQLQEAMAFVERCDQNAHNDQEEIMKMYNLGRIIKDQIMPSSLDLLRFVRTHDP